MNQEKIGKFIAELRKEKNLLQKDLAEKLGVDNRTISRWETGRSMPDLSMFPILSKELGVTVNDLMSGEIVDKKDYQEKFEENVINSISTVRHNNKVLYYLLIVVIFIIIMCISCCVVVNNVHFSLPYDEDKMYIEDSKYGLRFANKNLCTVYRGNIRKVTTSINVENEKVGIIFVTSYCSIVDLYDFYKKDVLNSYRWYYIEFPEVDFPAKYRIYYTKENLNDVMKLEEDELLKFIEKANLMYES